MYEKRKEKRKKAKQWDCTQPDYMRDRNFKRVGEWWFGGNAEKAERLLKKNPAKFYRLLNWADAESEAEPIQMQVAREKAKTKDKHKEAAKDSIAKRRRRVEKSSPDYDPADDAGDAFVD